MGKGLGRFPVFPLVGAGKAKSVVLSNFGPSKRGGGLKLEKKAPRSKEFPIGIVMIWHPEFFQILGGGVGQGPERKSLVLSADLLLGGPKI